MFTNKKVFIVGLLCFMGYISSVSAIQQVGTMEHKGTMYEVFLRSDVDAKNRRIDRICENTDKASFLSAYCTQYVGGLAAFTAPWDATFKATCKRVGSITGKYLMIPATLIAASSYMRGQQRLINSQYITDCLARELTDKHSNNSYNGWHYGYAYSFKEKTEHMKELPPHLESLPL